MPRKRKRKLLLPVVFFIGVITLCIYLGRHLIPVATTIVFHRNQNVQTTNGLTNIVLLGTGGANHDGPNLSDTIIVASINQKSNTIHLISLPRDLWIATISNSGGKLNEAYADGELNGQHKGLLVAKSVVGSVINQPIHYGFRIDFGGFVKAVDLIGGIDVHVTQGLDDYHYPIDGNENLPCGHSSDEITAFTATASADQLSWDFFPCRYKYLHVDTGTVHVDGTTALEYVRSRHGLGDQGTDFARSHRQQQVIEAFRAKILSLGILLNPSKLLDLYGVLQQSIDTDVPQEDIAPFIDLFQKMKTAKIYSTVIDDGSSSADHIGLLIDTTQATQYGDLFVLQPRIGSQNFSEIQSFVACVLIKGSCTIPQNSHTPVLEK